MATAEQMTAAVHAYVAAFDRGDAAAVAALFADDATVEDPIGSPPKRGHDEILAFYEGSMQTGARLALQEPIRCAADVAAFAFAVTLTIDGAPMRIDVIDIFEFDAHGKIASMRAYWGEGNMTHGADGDA